MNHPIVGHLLLLAVVLLLSFSSSQGQVLTRVQDDASLRYVPGELTLLVDPPTGAFSPTALGVFAQATSPTAILFYTIQWAVLGDTVVPVSYPQYNTISKMSGFVQTSDGLTLVPNTTTYVAYNNTPYIHINTPYAKGRNVVVCIIAVDWDIVEEEYFRSAEYKFDYIVEATDRQKAYGFFVPGPETTGHFVSFSIEMKAAARAQSAGGQEYADFFSDLGIGTYPDQVVPLHLPSVVPNLTNLEGYEGGFAVNMTNGRHYGILVPYHNGREFHGRVVRVDLQQLRRGDDGGNVTACSLSWRYEYYTPSGQLVTLGEPENEACVTVLDLASKHPNARGFRKGFAGYPYGFLAAGAFDVVVRLNMENFTLHNAIALDLSQADKSLGGFSGGFADGTWACFCPFKHFAASHGGIRSGLIVDRNTLRVYYSSEIVCVNSTGFEGRGPLGDSMITLDIGDLDPGLRGYSEALKVGRYVYLSPQASYTHTYTSRVVRLTLGPVDIAHTLAALLASGLRARAMMNVLDLAQKDPQLSGFSGLFSAGRYLYLVPYRNEHTPQTGQRGFGKLVRVNMNRFALDGIDVVDMPVTSRTQIPSFADIDLRCFSGGFSSGQYAVLVPFYNGVFSGKSARVTLYDKKFGNNLQELDFVRDRERYGIYKGFRGGFVSLWQGNMNIIV